MAKKTSKNGSDNGTVSLTEVRNYRVVKSNELIQRTRYELSLQEQKIILFLISKIKPEDKEFDLYQFEIKDFCRICGIDEESGKNYFNIKNAIKNLASRSMWITLPDGRETLLRWIDKPYIDKRSGTIEIKLDALMKPYLLQLKEKFTQYNLYYILALNSQYSIRLYELLMSFEYMGEYTFLLEDLKGMLVVKPNVEFKHFKQNILNVAIKEINNYTDLEISYEPIKTGRAYTHVKFNIEVKKDMNDRVDTWRKIEAIINKKNE